MKRSSKKTRSDFLSIKPCGRDLYELIPRKKVKIDLYSAARILKNAGYNIQEESELALTAEKDYNICIYPTGKMLVYPAKSGKDAESTAQIILNMLRR